MKKIYIILLVGVLLTSMSVAMAVDFDSDNIQTALEILSNTNLFNSDSNEEGIMDTYTINSQSASSVLIPEFPIIALPVAVVIGMMFLFQRRKGK